MTCPYGCEDAAGDGLPCDAPHFAFLCTQTMSERTRWATVIEHLPPFVHRDRILAMLRGSTHRAQYPDESDDLYLSPTQVCVVMSGVMTFVNARGEALVESDMDHRFQSGVVRALEDLMGLIRAAWVPYCATIHRRRQQMQRPAGEESSEEDDGDGN